MAKNSFLDLSIVIPAYNEVENVGLLYERLVKTLTPLGRSHEIIFVDDGSSDGTQDALKRLAQKDLKVKLVLFRKNYGQTAAMSAGFQHAAGNVIITLDADLQNDPADIPKLLEKMEEGFDLVSGWRKDRQDAFLSRKLPSILANKLISHVGGIPLKDYGCTLKAYKRHFIKDMDLFGEMHRFIPIYAAWMGARITEIPVHHEPRARGKSKYGLWRTFKVILDLMTVKFLESFSTKPIYIFGGLGLLFLLVGGLTSGFVLIQKLAYGIWVHKNPLLLISIYFMLIGFQSVLMGLLAELVIRIYYESHRRPAYWVREKVNLEDPSCVESPDT